MKTKRLTALLTSLVMALTILGGTAVFAESETSTIQLSEKNYFKLQGIDKHQPRVGCGNVITEEEFEAATLGLKFSLSDITDADFIKSATLNVTINQIHPYITNVTQIKGNYQPQYDEWSYDAATDKSTYVGENYVYNTYLYPMTTDWTVGAAVTNDNGDYLYEPWTKDVSEYIGYPNTENLAALAHSSQTATGNRQKLTFTYDITSDIKAKKTQGSANVAYTLINRRNGANGGVWYNEYNCLDGSQSSAEIVIETMSSSEILAALNAITNPQSELIAKYMKAILGEGWTDYVRYEALSENGKAIVNTMLTEADLTTTAVLKTTLNSSIEAYLSGEYVEETEKDGVYSVYNGDFGYFQIKSGKTGQWRVGLDSSNGIDAVTLGMKFDISDIKDTSVIKSAKVIVNAREKNPGTLPYTYRTDLYPMTTDWTFGETTGTDVSAVSPWSKTLTEYTGYPNKTDLMKITSCDKDAVAANADISFEYDVTADIKDKISQNISETAYAMAVKRASDDISWDEKHTLNAQVNEGANVTLVVEKYTDSILLSKLNEAENFEAGLKTILGENDRSFKAFAALSENEKASVAAIISQSEFTTVKALKASLESECAKYAGKTLTYKGEKGYFDKNQGRNGENSQFRIGINKSGIDNTVVLGTKFDLTELAGTDYIKKATLSVSMTQMDPESERYTYMTNLYSMSSVWPEANNAWDGAQTGIENTFPNTAGLSVIGKSNDIATAKDEWLNFSFDVTADVLSKIQSGESAAAYALENVRPSYIHPSWKQDDCLNGQSAQVKLIIDTLTEDEILAKYNAAENKEEAVKVVINTENIYTALPIATIVSELNATYETYENLVNAIKGLYYTRIENVTDAASLVVNKTDADLSAVIFAAAYKGNRLVDIVTADKAVLSAGESYTFSYDFGGKDFDTINVFVWDSLSSIKPYCAQGIYTK